MTGWVYLRGGEVGGGSIALAALPFALSWVAGTRLLRDQPNARSLAILTQALQVPIVVLPILTWKFVAGVIVSLSLRLEGLRLFAGLETTWFVGSGSLGGLPAELGVNIVPVAVIVWLIRDGRRADSP